MAEEKPLVQLGDKAEKIRAQFYELLAKTNKELDLPRNYWIRKALSISSSQEMNFYFRQLRRTMNLEDEQLRGMR